MQSTNLDYYDFAVISNKAILIVLLRTMMSALKLNIRLDLVNFANFAFIFLIWCKASQSLLKRLSCLEQLSIAHFITKKVSQMHRKRNLKKGHRIHCRWRRRIILTAFSLVLRFWRLSKSQFEWRGRVKLLFFFFAS